MNVKVMRFLLVAAIVAVVGVAVAGGIVASRAYADSPWGRGWCGDYYEGFSPMGRGMMGGWGDWGEFCPLFDDVSRPGPDDEAQAERTPLSLEDVEARVEAFLREKDDNLALAEVMEFSNHFYAEAVEKDTGFGAVEMLIDRYTGKVYPEMGPNMMWNEKYGMMGGRRGMMMGSWWTNRSSDPAKMPVTPDEAIKQAQEYLADRDTGLTVDKDDVTTFYGYYTLHTLKDGQPEGMLSVNGYSGRVWYHTWHGDFVRMSEHDEGVSGHAEEGQAQPKP